MSVTTTRTGHRLVADAAAFKEDGTRLGSGTAGTGRAHCECTWKSDILDSGTKRRKAHRAHLQELHDADNAAPVHASAEAIEAAIAAGEADAAEADAAEVWVKERLDTAEDLLGEAPAPAPAKKAKRAEKAAQAPETATLPEGAVTIQARDIQLGDKVVVAAPGTRKGAAVAAFRVAKWVTALDSTLRCVLYARPEDQIQVIR